MAFISGVPVAEFQMDGLFSIDTYMNHTGGISQKNLSDFTLCMRQNVNFFRGKLSHSLSFSTLVNDNSLIVWWIHDITNLLAPLKFIVCKYVVITDSNDCIFHEINVKIHQEWHHFCFVQTYQNTNQNQVESTMKLFYDGTLVKTSKYCSNNVYDVTCDIVCTELMNLGLWPYKYSCLLTQGAS